MGIVKRKDAFKHAKNSQILIILRMRTRNFVLVFTLYTYMYILFYPIIQLADSEGPDQTARMRRLIWIITVRQFRKGRFRMAWPILFYVVFQDMR